MHIEEILLVLMVMLTSTISGIFGMSGGIILMGILNSILSVPQAMVTHGIAQASANGFRFLSLKKHILWKPTLIYFLGAIVAVFIFSIYKFIPSKKMLFLALSFVSFLSFIPKVNLNFEKKFQAFLCGVIVNITQLFAGVSGTVLDIFFVKTKLSRYQIVATKAVTQTLGHVLKFTFYISVISAQDLQKLSLFVILAIIIAALVGTLLGIKILKKMSDHHFQKWTRYIIFILACFYLYKGIATPL